MKTLGCVLSVLAGLTALAHLQAFQVSRFAGTWHGKANGLPAVTLTVQETAGKLTGAIVFYLQKRDAVDLPWRVDGGAVEPLIDPRVDGERLLFEVRRGGDRVAMSVDLSGVNEARLAGVRLERER